MSRSKSTVPGHRRRRKIVKSARGNYGGRHRLYRTARETVQKGLAYAYRDRRNRKREFRALWIIRINAAARQLGLSYSIVIDRLKKANIDLDRKSLAHLAATDFEGFRRVVEAATAR
jgi:large subunit ribosomal protein L20